MKGIKAIGVLGLLVVITLIAFTASTGKAAEVEEHIWKTVDLINNYNTNGNAAIEDSDAIFYRYTGLKTKPLGLDAGQGNTITKIEFKRDGEVVRTVQVNSRTYNEAVQFSGEPVVFESEDNTAHGGWFAWQLGSDSVHWTEGLGGDYDSITSLGTPPKRSGTSPPADAYPNVLVQQTVKYDRNIAFKNIQYPNIYSTAYLDNTPSVLDILNPDSQMDQNVKIRMGVIEASDEDKGQPDDSINIIKYLPYYTIEAGQPDAGQISLGKATITFTQRHDNETYYRKLAAGNAAMLYYYSNFKYSFKTYSYRYPNEYVVYIKGTASPSPTPGPTPGNSAVECTEPVPDQTISGEFLDPGVAAEIRADQRGNEQFDVLQGIPSSESLYGHASAKSYLYQNKFVEMKGTCTYNIKINKTYTLKWDPTKPAPTGGGSVPDPKSEPKPVVYPYSISRPYSYWTVNTLEIYALTRSLLMNDALPGGQLTIEPSGYTAPEFSTEIKGKFLPPQAPASITIPSSDVQGGTTKPEPPDELEAFRSKAEEAAKKIQVQNDSFVFIGQTIMNGSEVTETGQAPGTIPNPQLVGDNVLYSPGNMIDPTHLNASHLSSSGEITYAPMNGNINGSSGVKSYPINGINSVTVHTPVVNYSLLPDDNRPYDQRMDPDYDRTVLILDRPFTVHFTESGQHLNIPGYGNRDYGKYTQNKRIQFPFDVFQEGQYYPENTWINIPVGTPYMNFTMPTWVNEGNYTIHTQSWAINAPSDGAELCQVNLNGNLANYCAAESFNVGVVGRLFDFRIWDIGDFRFEKVFRTGTGNLDHSSAMYYTGGNDENGAPTALSGQRQWHLPIRKGSHPTEQLTVPHNGYSFLFDFRTIGNLWQPGEGIRIEPSFYFIPKTGGSAAPVDLYYDVSGSGNKMIGVGSSKDKLSYTRTYRLADGLRNISGGELSTAASYEYNYILTEAERGQTNWLKFYEKYIKRKTEISEGYKLEILPYTSRTLVGPTNIPNGVNPIAAVRSVQHWYGEYNLPIAPYILPKGTNIVTLANHYGGALDGHEQEFITGGYILVKFEIYTLKNSDAGTRILGYKAPEANMWAIEGQMTADTDEMGQTFSFTSGDIILFESDFSVRNDYQGQGK
ncbi:DUF5704 domain-containing protein [Paenibacillus sp. FSL R10-2736]|uniref:DUF5704 domain-containing protein n=1 Tax=Paenibacillus sp. FSL R10-2736 TaxID=2954692 RepID=UPI0030FA7F63